MRRIFKAWSDIASNMIDRTERETINQHTPIHNREQDSDVSFWLSKANKARIVTPEFICQGGYLGLRIKNQLISKRWLDRISCT